MQLLSAVVYVVQNLWQPQFYLRPNSLREFGHEAQWWTKERNCMQSAHYHTTQGSDCGIWKKGWECFKNTFILLAGPSWLPWALYIIYKVPGNVDNRWILSLPELPSGCLSLILMSRPLTAITVLLNCWLLDGEVNFMCSHFSKPHVHIDMLD